MNETILIEFFFTEKITVVTFGQGQVGTSQMVSISCIV